jgi:hypothetical protein
MTPIALTILRAGLDIEIEVSPDDAEWGFSSGGGAWHLTPTEEAEARRRLTAANRSDDCEVGGGKREV